MGDLICSSQVGAEAVRDDLATWITNNPTDIFNVDNPPRSVSCRDGWHMIFDVRFQTRLAAEQLYNKIENQWSSGPLAAIILTGSQVSLHDCTHDVDQGDCSGGNVLIAVK